MNQKNVWLRPSSLTYLQKNLEKRRKQIKKTSLKKIYEKWYDLEEEQVHYKLCETNEEYNEIDIILKAIFS